MKPMLRKAVNFGARILMYHSVADNPTDRHAIPVSEFARQLDELAKRRDRILDLRTLISRLTWTGDFRDKVALTFDDGYEDFLFNAMPILEEHGLSATLFVPTGMVGKTASWDSYDKTKRIMDWDQLREVQRCGFDIASHTMSHPNLVHCALPELAYELKQPLETLRDKLGDVTPIISYPGGYYTRREMKAAQNAGYIAAVGVASHWQNYPWTNRFRLRRCRWESESGMDTD